MINKKHKINKKRKINKKYRIFLVNIKQKIDYKDIDLLNLFLTEQGKILPRKVTGITIQQQRKLTKAVKRARILSLLPFVASNQFNRNK